MTKNLTRQPVKLGEVRKEDAIVEKKEKITRRVKWQNMETKSMRNMEDVTKVKHKVVKKIEYFKIIFLQPFY
jgi:hypothetical protein